MKQNCNCNWCTFIAPSLEDRRRITESIRILVPVDRIKQNVFKSRRNKSVDRNSFSSVGSLFHARGAATEKAYLTLCYKLTRFYIDLILWIKQKWAYLTRPLPLRNKLVGVVKSLYFPSTQFDFCII